MKQKLLNNLKNIYGWRTDRKIVVLSIDDYGNVRLASRAARSDLDKAGLKVYSVFDALDTLENREDLEMLYEALDSVKDKNGNAAVFTPFAIPCNIDFEKMAANNYTQYEYELLPDTYQKLAAIDPTAYKGTWKLWQEGIDKGFMVPQYHGREHFNLKLFNQKLKQRDKALLVALKNRSNTSIASEEPNISYTAAYEFEDFSENEKFPDILTDGMNAFEKVFGYRAVHFNPPGGREHPVIHHVLEKNGIRYTDTPFMKNEHQGNGTYKRIVNYTGKKALQNLTYQVRNVVFEPAEDRGFEWVQHAIDQIAAAFFWKRPAIISSHRVNFCGHIDPNNRKAGLAALKRLLSEIVSRWPDVEFMSAPALGDLIEDQP